MSLIVREERIVSTTEEQRVDAPFPDRRQAIVGERAQLVVVGLAAFDEFDESRTGDQRQHARKSERCRGALVRSRRDRRCRPDDPDVTVPRRTRRRPQSRFDDADDGDVEAVTQQLERRRGRRIARDDEHLHAAVFNEIGRDLLGEVPDLFVWTLAIGIPRRVSGVDELLVREQIDQRPHDGESPEAAVEDADRTIIHVPNRLFAAIDTARRTIQK